MLLAASALGMSLTGQAFGPDGHRIIAELAQRQLSPTALAEVRRLLGDQADDGLAGIANWADEIREAQAWRHTSRWHYVNFPRDDCAYDAGRDCKGGRCVVAAIGEQAAILGDRARGDDERTRALRFLVHFVGDIHQPLHAGHGDDRGGNTFQVFYLGRGSNLHALWDGGILRSARLDWRGHVHRLAARAPDRRARRGGAWSARAPVRWAEESCRLIGSAAVYPPSPGKLPDDYVQRQYPVVERQLVVAATRLAAVLDAVLVADDDR